MLEMIADVTEHYKARNYAAVVQILGDAPRGMLLANPDQGFMLADAGRRVGGVTNVVALIADVVAVARAQRARPVLCNALNLQGVLLLEAGHALAAERAWCELVDVATEADNPEFVARASNNLGVAAILSMRLDDAIVSFNRSVAAYVRLNYSRGLAQSHQNLGIVYREMDQHKESLASFERALTWAYTADCMDDVARAEQELSLLLLYGGKDIGTAASTAYQALGRFTDLGQPAGRAEALRVIGLVEFVQGNIETAERALNESLEGARSCGQRLLEAEVLLALASLPPAPQRSYQIGGAEAIFEEMGATAWGAQVRKRMEALA
jgi:tetratricopeptide (TPR) repeat protein